MSVDLVRRSTAELVGTAFQIIGVGLAVGLVRFLYPSVEEGRRGGHPLGALTTGG